MTTLDIVLMVGVTVLLVAVVAYGEWSRARFEDKQRVRLERDLRQIEIRTKIRNLRRAMQRTPDGKGTPEDQARMEALATEYTEASQR